VRFWPGLLVCGAVALCGCGEVFEGGEAAAGGSAGTAGGGGSAGTGGSEDCPPGQGECDGDAQTYCETDTTSNPAHCGWCDHDCLGGGCVDSVCQPVELVPEDESRGSGGEIAMQGHSLYFTQGSGSGRVGKVAKDGSGMTWLAEGRGSPRGIAVDAESVYWTDIAWHEVNKVPIDGGSIFNIVSGGVIQVGAPLSLAEQGLLFYDPAVPDLKSVALDGSGLGHFDDACCVSSLAFTAQAFYWSTDSQVFQRIHTEAAVAIAQGQARPRGVVTDETYVYWTNFDWDGATSGHEVKRWNKTTYEAKTLAQRGAFSLALDDTHVYAADCKGGEIWRVPKEGGNTETLATGLSYPLDIEVGTEAIFWVSETGAGVYRLAK
jgi:hypothetical protein